MQVGVHARLEDRDAAELAELRGVRLVAERAGDQHVVVGVGGFAGGGDEIGPGDGAELGADEDARAAFGASFRVTLDVAAFSAYQVTRPGGERGKDDPVLPVCLLHARGLQVLQDHGREVLLAVSGLALGEVVDQFVVFTDTERAVRRKALNGERTGDADDAPILVGLVVQVFEVRLRGDGCVNLLLTGDARVPPLAVQVGWASVPWVARLVGNRLDGVVPAQRAVQCLQRPSLRGV